MNAATDLSAGEMVLGRYKVVRLLGRGQMGVVYEGTDATTGQSVALKTLQDFYPPGDPILKRFEREAAIASKLQTRHVARVFELGQLADGRPVMALEHLTGMDLEALVTRFGKLPAETTIAYATQAAIGLAEAHGQGIIHRDIKTENLFLNNVKGEAFIKILDFGISKFIDPDRTQLTSAGQSMGSPYFMSPEQYRSPKCLDARTDLWSLGVVMHRLLSAELPFPGRTMGEVFVAVDRKDPTPLPANVPPALAEVILTCLAKDPDDRYETADDLLRALESIRISPAPKAAPSSDW